MAAAGEPMFVRWLDPANPGDATILAYWGRVQSGEASPAETIDLGTMLFHRGFPNDAVDLYRRALDDDPALADGWLQLGLVEHAMGQTRAAERAYRRCLKHSPQQPWCQFYLGRLLEQTGRVQEALEHYRAALTIAPQLGNPELNPEVLRSELALGARIHAHEAQRFTDTAPLPFAEPDAVGKTLRSFLPPTPVPPTPAPTAAPAPAAGAVGVGGVDGEGHAKPRRPEPHPQRATSPREGDTTVAPNTSLPQPVPPEVPTASGTAVFRPR